MPTMKSAKKRLRQNIKHNLRNRAFKTSLRTQIKKFLGSVKEGNVRAAEKELQLTVKKLKITATAGLCHALKEGTICQTYRCALNLTSRHCSGRTRLFVLLFLID